MRKDREPLRIPDNWRGQDRQFVIQLERVLDYMSWSIIPETYDWGAITNKPANYPGGCTGTAGGVAWENVSSKPANYPGGCTGTAGGVAWDNVSSKPANYPGGCTGAAGSVAWDNVTGKPSSFTPSSHTHDISNITWAGGSNLACNGANTEWSIDMASSATGSYWHVWSGKNGKSVLICYNDNCNVSIPNGTLSTAAITMTGNLTLSGSGRAIAYTGTKATYNMIKFIDNTSDTYGNGISIGGGGLVIVGAGESSDAIASGKSGGDETLYLGGDGNVYIMSNVQNGVASAKTYTFDTSGNLILPSGSRVGGSGGALYLGNSGNQSWVYVQDMASQSDANNWKITQAGRGTFKELYLGSQDMGAAVKSISRSGNTFTATQCNGSTFTFTQTDTLPSSSSSSATGFGVTCYVYKYGNVVSFILPAQNVNNSVSAGNTLLTLPSGYRPPRECCFMGSSNGWGGYNMFKVQTGGALQPMVNPISKGGAVAVCGSFIVT